MDSTAYSQTGCSDLASAPELSPCGARAAATSPPAFVNKPCPFSNSYLTSNLLNLTHTTLHSTLFAIADKRRPSPSNGGNAVHPRRNHAHLPAQHPVRPSGSGHAQRGRSIRDDRQVGPPGRAGRLDLLPAPAQQPGDVERAGTRSTRRRRRSRTGRRSSPSPPRPQPAAARTSSSPGTSTAGRPASSRTRMGWSTPTPASRWAASRWSPAASTRASAVITEPVFPPLVAYGTI